MQFGTVNGNAYKCASIAFQFAAANPGDIDYFISALIWARSIRIRNMLLSAGNGSGWVEGLDHLSNEGLGYYAGCGIEIAAGLQ
jgi:hypothetical protein